MYVCVLCVCVCMSVWYVLLWWRVCALPGGRSSGTGPPRVGVNANLKA